MEPIFLEGDCLAVLETLEPDSFDAIVTDPPYGIGFMGREWDTFRPDAASKRRALSYDRAVIETDNPNLKGRRRSPSISPSQIEYDMSPAGLHRFEAWCREWARGCFRVLKPGGYLVAFGAPRAYHRLACGVEDAGFEVRDALDWIFGTGFPKSIDGEREVARAMCTHPGRHFLRKLPATDRRPDDHVCEATELSRRFLGVGSALKPAHEPIVLARKPFQGTLGRNLIAYGVGGLHVDATRLGSTPADRDRAKLARMAGAHVELEAGRWPPNLILGHLPECIPAGRAKVRNRSGYTTGLEPSASTSGAVYGEGFERKASSPYADAEGLETVDAWLCAEGCPVAEVDQQSGESATPDTVTRGSSSRRNTFNIQSGPLLEVPSYGDAGGASRFFPTFRYEPKPDRLERDRGCEDLPARTGAEATDRKQDAAALKSPRTGAGRTGGARNFHPTVKPLALMRWLIRLVAAPGQRILDPFCGSGTTPAAAKLEGVECVAIEREPDYLAIAVRRCAAVHRAGLLAAAEGLEAEPDTEADYEQAGLLEDLEASPDGV
jgi:DNA modification methylase